MAFTNYAELTVFASGARTATSGTSGTVVLPETVSSVFIAVIKTAEGNADNLLTFRLQANIGAGGASDWRDVPWTWTQDTVATSVAADAAPNLVRKPNMTDNGSDSDTQAAFERLTYYDSLPSNSIRVRYIASGTTLSHTFGMQAAFRFNHL